MSAQDSDNSLTVGSTNRALILLSPLIFVLSLPASKANDPTALAPQDTSVKPTERVEIHQAPKPRTVTGLTLDQAISLCLTNDPKLRAGVEAVNQARAEALTVALETGPSLLPQLLPLPRPFPVDESCGPQQSVQVSYATDGLFFGERPPALASAELSVLISEAEFADLVRKRILEVTVAFYDALEAQAMLELTRQDVQNLRRVQALTEKGAKTGGRSAVDLARVSLHLLKSEQAVRHAEAEQVITKVKLGALLGGLEWSAFEVVGDLDAPLTGMSFSVEGAIVLAEENRPDIQALRWKIRKAGTDMREEKPAYSDATASYGHTHPYPTRAIGFLEASSWIREVEMTLPPFARNQDNQAEDALSNLDLQAGLLNLRTEINMVVQEFSTAMANSCSVEQVDLQLAHEVRDSMNKAFEAGTCPLLDALHGLRNYRETYRLYISGRANYCRSAGRFNAAVAKQVFQRR